MRPVHYSSRTRPECGFDYSAAMRCLCGDIVGRLEPLAHIVLDRVAITLTQTRKGVSHGMQASLTPLRFAGGQLTMQSEGRQYRIERVVRPDGGDYLYMLSFFLPRFQEHTFEEKLTTVMHELWHISPRFDGDLRRHAGRCYAHGPSQRAYDAHAAALARQWLSLDPPLYMYAFLQQSFEDLHREYGRVFGQRARAPRLVAVKSALDCP